MRRSGCWPRPYHSSPSAPESDEKEQNWALGRGRIQLVLPLTTMTAVGRMTRSPTYAWTPRNSGPRASVLSDKRDLALGFFRRPPIRLGAGAAHQHCTLGVAEAVSL